MMNKRGQEISRIGGLLIGILCLLLIVTAVVLVYSAVTSNNPADNAKITLNSLEGKINLLTSGESNTFLVQGFVGANNWGIDGWSQGDNPDTKPSQCYFQTCICICPLPGNLGPGVVSEYYNFESPILAGGNVLSDVPIYPTNDSCSSGGFCRTFSQPFVIVNMSAALYTGPDADSVDKNLVLKSILLQQNSIGISISKNSTTIVLQRTF